MKIIEMFYAVNASDSYSRGIGIVSWPGDGSIELGSSVFLSSSMEILR
jgi:hypothetical protein